MAVVIKISSGYAYLLEGELSLRGDKFNLSELLFFWIFLGLEPDSLGGVVLAVEVWKNLKETDDSRAIELRNCLNCFWQEIEFLRQKKWDVSDSSVNLRLLVQRYERVTSCTYEVFRSDLAREKRREFWVVLLSVFSLVLLFLFVVTGPL